ncbi:MAG: response regulator transcription factor [Sphingobacteriales bacterium]|nr:MAG: response regulator transcription factor [Sphingobacteriales bacterium]
MRCMIIDDEPLALELMEDNIRQIPFLTQVASCRNALEAIEVLQKESVDLIFSDIEMPGIDGIKFIQTLRQKPLIILITAYEQYAVQGYDLDIVDYLLKPVSFERFLKACNKAREVFTYKHTTAVTPEATHPFIFVQADYSLVKVMLDEINYIEALKDYVKIHYNITNKRSLMVRMSMKGLEDMLPPQKFIRIHKSFIISIDKITAIRKNLIFIGDIELPVGDLYKDALQSLISRYT